MNIKQGIESSIKGGYSKEQRLTALGIMKSVHEMLLDINFWKCLGKNEGWGGIEINNGIAKRVLTPDQRVDAQEWVYRLHEFTSNIADSKTIDRAFELSTN